MQRQDECIRQCWDCRHICQTTLYTHCLVIGGVHMEEVHVKAMIDCIDICQLAADVMTRRSGLVPSICQLCAEACEICAKSCERIGDESMLACAKACQACAKSCREHSRMPMAA